jgi:hypothetical protein
VAEQERTSLHDNPDVSHEQSDVSIRGIVVFAVALLVVAFVIHVALYWLLEFYREKAPSPKPVITAPRAEEQIPPPRLQISPRADLAEMRAAQERELTTYGWADKEKQSVRIPIDRAMELLAKRGLPARKQTRESRNGEEVKKQR